MGVSLDEVTICDLKNNIMEDSVKEKIIELELKLLEPDVRKSVDELDRLLADKFVEFGSAGVKYNKEQIIKTLESESGIQFTATEFDVEELSADAVMITYQVTIKQKGVEKGRNSLRCSIWRFIDDRWQMLFHQGTIISD